MPAVSKAQRRAMAIAKHDPGKLYARNRSLVKMSGAQLSDFASTKETNLPHKKKKTKKKRAAKKPASKRKQLKLSKTGSTTMATYR